MRTILVTGSDTGIGKTRVVGALARLLAGGGARVQVVKVVETGVAAGAEGDAECARRLAGLSSPAGGELGRDVTAITLQSFSAALAPAAAAAAEKRTLSLEALVAATRALPECDWRVCEGAGGIASPLDALGRDWTDFAASAGVAAIVLVVPDRLGAINQARLTAFRAAEAGLRSGIWLNACAPVDPAVAGATRAGLLATGLELWAEQAYGADLPTEPERLLAVLRRIGAEGAGFDPAQARGRRPAGGGGETPAPSAAPALWLDRCRSILLEREGRKLRRILRVAEPKDGLLNLADNDYLDLARDPAVAAAAAATAAREGTSASASPLVTGWREAHALLVGELASWHRRPCGLLWSSGYAANSAVLGTLPAPGDLVLADRLIHHSMIAGLRRSGARIRRYPHLDLDRLEAWLEEERGTASGAAKASAPRPSARAVFVVTESVFSMDGDYPDLVRLAALKRRHGFCWILDEAHALGWYGPEGAGLARAAGVEDAVDVLVGTLGKTLASGGAYTLFRDEAVRDTLINLAGEFIYSTALPPANAAAASAALLRVRTLAAAQPEWHAASRAFRAALRTEGWSVPEGDSPVVPVRLDDEDAALALAEALREAGILAAAVRPPTVPVGTSRLRFSLKRTLGPAERRRVVAAMGRWRAGR